LKRPEIISYDTPEEAFDPATWRRAKRIAATYRVVIEPAKDGFLATSIEMPTVAIHGATVDECFKEVKEALAIGVACMLEWGRTPPGTGGRRTAQVNIRLTYDEKLRLEESARDAGFRGLSDYVRHAALLESRRCPPGAPAMDGITPSRRNRRPS
jgi:predicted RNase H-like HicB family nuclease